MNERTLSHFGEFGTYTYPGLYQKLLQRLPDNVPEIGLLVRKSFIHRTTLAAGNVGTNADMRYGDMTKVPWWRQPEDDNLVTAAAMLAELYRRDENGFSPNRHEENKLVLTCRYVAVLMASILKSKGIPTRARSGFDPYSSPMAGKACDHWINEYWKSDENRWIAIDVDCSINPLDFDPYDMPKGKFILGGEAWLAIREGRQKPEYFWNAGGFTGALPAAWALFYDFHSLMNSEILYLHSPAITIPGIFEKLTKQELAELDELAHLTLEPDKNFDKLQNLWENKREYRLLTGALL